MANPNPYELAFGDRFVAERHHSVYGPTVADFTVTRITPSGAVIGHGRIRGGGPAPVSARFVGGREVLPADAKRTRPWVIVAVEVM